MNTLIGIYVINTLSNSNHNYHNNENTSNNDDNNTYEYTTYI